MWKYERSAPKFWPVSLNAGIFFLVQMVDSVFAKTTDPMSAFDFKRYHMRSINAASGEERAAINQELKDLYATLSEKEKEAFNAQLQRFLSTEVGRLKSDYESINGLGGEN